MLFPKLRRVDTSLSRLSASTKSLWAKLSANKVSLRDKAILN